MASSRELQIIATLKDNVSQQLSGLSGKLKSHQATFTKMAAIGTAAFAGLTYGVKKAVDEAGIAEGSWNKFNTVFAEGADDMKDFVNDLRKTMPLATHEIARMGADLQDLLIPMGLSREEAAGLTKGSLDLANKLAAFNDVNPAVVLEAMKSGFVGMSEPLRRFGIDAKVSSLEAIAQKEGLIGLEESFNDLEPAIRASIQAQALMIQMTTQSADAISGFEENQDSYVRRMQELNATLKEFKVAIGEAVLPIIDRLLKKLLPVVKAMVEWGKTHSTAIKVIIGITLALTGLVAIIGTLGLILPSIIAGIGFVGAAFSLVGAVVLMAIVVIAALIKIGWDLYHDWDLIIEGYKIIFNDMKDNTLAVVNDIKNAFWGLIDWFRGLPSRIWEAIKSIPGKIASAFKLPSINLPSWLPQFAEGGVVGGVGPKLAVVHGGETIIPANRSAGMGGGLTININSPIYGMEARDVADKLSNIILRNLRSEYKL